MNGVVVVAIKFSYDINYSLSLSLSLLLGLGVYWVVLDLCCVRLGILGFVLYLGCVGFVLCWVG